mgnify:CR=1 FL=1
MVHPRAYPRVCGAASVFAEARNHCCGLSPRVRGNRIQKFDCRFVRGPIPACAGQPLKVGTFISIIRAYPRVCGATRWIHPEYLIAQGLSPRVRGNLPKVHKPASGRGPIPACAGQPLPESSQGHPAWAYPRVCGATACGLSFSFFLAGLSPRVRGNRDAAKVNIRASGPIPACAGQPEQQRFQAFFAWAYPRVCGATSTISRMSRAVSGLSPRVRGNRTKTALAGDIAGPIPACAGQPVWGMGMHYHPRAYPRVCGAATAKARHAPALMGLSPRVRGSRIRARLA